MYLRRTNSVQDGDSFIQRANWRYDSAALGIGDASTESLTTDLPVEEQALPRQLAKSRPLPFLIHRP